MKYDCIYLHALETRLELRAGLARWIGYYSTRCSHSSLGGQTPNEAYDAIGLTERQ
jgi:putative transposase